VQAGIRYGVLGNQRSVARCADANIFTGHDMIPDDQTRGRIQGRWLRVEFFAIGKFIEVTRAAVLNRIEPTWLQMMMEKMPECRLRELANVRGIVYNDVKSFRSSPVSNFR
jgi:hypothetical protein